MKPHRPSEGFSLLELLVVISILAVLAGLLLPALNISRQATNDAKCLASLHQLGVAMALYEGDHKQGFVRYRQVTDAGTVWYFGLETTDWTAGEGDRTLDETQGPLYPYTNSVGGIVICPAFDYGSALWKPKFEGASWGYGYNYNLGGGASGALPVKHVTDLQNPSQVVVFGDCAQVNTFQPPASPSNPMVEEFYIIDQFSTTIHFRHTGVRANFLFADGHAASLPMYPGTLDSHLPSANIGRITPMGSMKYLQ